MPLPPALAARLAKRGIVSESVLKEGSEKKSKLDTEEEVIAENYDSNFKSNAVVPNYNQENEEVTSIQADKHFKGHSGCPNKWNVYHECTSFCIRQWGKGKVIPDLIYMRKFNRLMAKYPLPSNWKEVYDPGTGRHYFWEMSSDMVSWLPPAHPKAAISESAATVREDRHLVATDADGSDRDSDSSNEEEEEILPRGKEEKKVERDRKHNNGRVKTKPNDLDPMDPAAYSEAPRGKWSDGLDRGIEAKTGVDVTASGPLYQMRDRKSVV